MSAPDRGGRPMSVRQPGGRPYVRPPTRLADARCPSADAADPRSPSANAADRTGPSAAEASGPIKTRRQGGRHWSARRTAASGDARAVRVADYLGSAADSTGSVADGYMEGVRVHFPSLQLSFVVVIALSDVLLLLHCTSCSYGWRVGVNFLSRGRHFAKFIHASTSAWVIQVYNWTSG